MKNLSSISIVFISLLFLSGCLATNRLTGYVIKVQDGDSMTVLMNEDNSVKVRLDGIDAPEIGQDFSQKSKKQLSDLVADKRVTIISKGEDQYGRLLGVVFVGKLNVNEEMVRLGLAWQYKYNKEPIYLALQEEAQQKRLNIWSAKNPIDPWQWRKNQKKK